MSIGLNDITKLRGQHICWGAKRYPMINTIEGAEISGDDVVLQFKEGSTNIPANLVDKLLNDEVIDYNFAKLDMKMFISDTGSCIPKNGIPLDDWF